MLVASSSWYSRLSRYLFLYNIYTISTVSPPVINTRSSLCCTIMEEPSYLHEGAAAAAVDTVVHDTTARGLDCSTMMMMITHGTIIITTYTEDLHSYRDFGALSSPPPPPSPPSPPSRCLLHGLQRGQ